MKEAAFTKTFRSAIQNLDDIENVSSHRILRSSSFYYSIEEENQHTFCVLLNFGYLHTKKNRTKKQKKTTVVVTSVLGEGTSRILIASIDTKMPS